MTKKPMTPEDLEQFEAFAKAEETGGRWLRAIILALVAEVRRLTSDVVVETTDRGDG